MTKSRESFGTLLALAAAITSGISTFLNKIFIVSLDPLIFTATRAIFLGGIFFVLSLYKSRWDIRSFKKIPWKYLVAIGFVGGGLAFFLFFSGLKLTTSGRAAFLQRTLPLYVTVFAFLFLKEKIGKKQIFALLLMLIGTVILSSAEITPSELWSNPHLGDVLVISATVLWAVENTISKKAMVLGENNFIVSFGRMFFGALFLFGTAVIFNKVYLLSSVTAMQWLYILISTAALFVYVLSYYWSMKHINVSKASTILSLSPIITLLLGVSFLKESALSMQIFGSIVILVGACLVCRIKSELSKT